MTLTEGCMVKIDSYMAISAKVMGPKSKVGLKMHLSEGLSEQGDVFLKDISQHLLNAHPQDSTHPWVAGSSPPPLSS